MFEINHLSSVIMQEIQPSFGVLPSFINLQQKYIPRHSIGKTGFPYHCY